jgi:hypothetical protein
MTYIEDNFLAQDDFDELQAMMTDCIIHWQYNDEVDYPGQKGKFQFTHDFYTASGPSPYFETIEPILQKIFPMSLWRIKTNLLTRTPDIIENEFHVDCLDLSEEKLKQWTTSIFYINTNNGYTEFQDGRISMENTIVKSVANRMVTFPSNLRHRGTSCTDENTRIVINFNYFK